MGSGRKELDAHVHHWLRQHGIDAEHPIIAGVSGGRDSMVLAEALRRANQPLVVAHVNYGLRGSDSDDDEACVREWCSIHHIPFHVHQEKLLVGAEGMQAAARKVRYEWMGVLRQDLLKAGETEAYIAMAHHRDDQIETVLLQAMRSADPMTLSGMVAHRQDRSIIRPLLDISRSRITEWAKQQNITYRDDASNFEADYLRNRLRLQALPLLEVIRPGTGEHLARMASRLQPIADYVEQAVQAGLKRCYVLDANKEGVLDLDAWQDEALALELLHCVASTWGITSRAVRELHALCQQNIASGARFETTHVRVERRSRVLHFQKRTPQS